MSRISKASVVKYLREHPDFFIDNPAGLEDINLKHETGGAISLIEYQVRFLRRKNAALSEELNKLIKIARDNNRISAAIHNLTLAIIQSGKSNDMLAEIVEYLQKEFKVDFCHILKVSAIKKEALTELKRKLNRDMIFFGKPGKKLSNELFSANAGKVKSAACIYVKFDKDDRLLALGSKDENRYRESIGSHFLMQISELIAFSLSRKPAQKRVRSKN